MNNPLVSVIVPTKNSEKFLEACLKSIKEQTYSPVEIIVVDNFSTDKTVEIAKKYTELVHLKGPERSAQRNFGAKKADGKYLLFIDSDMELSPKVVEECVDLATKQPGVTGIVIPEESFGDGFWAQCKRLERSFYIGIDWIEAARFFTSDSFWRLKGYNEKNTGTEDFDLPQRMKLELGNSCIHRINALIFHNEGNIKLYKTCRKKFYYAQKLGVYQNHEANKEKFRKQASPFSRYKLFFSKPGKLLENPLYGLGMIFMKTCEFGAGALGYLIKGS